MSTYRATLGIEFDRDGDYESRDVYPPDWVEEGSHIYVDHFFEKGAAGSSTTIDLGGWSSIADICVRMVSSSPLEGAVTWRPDQAAGTVKTTLPAGSYVKLGAANPAGDLELDGESIIGVLYEVVIVGEK